MDKTVLIAFSLTLIAGLSTGIGSLISFFAKKTNTKMLSFSLGLSAGVMIYVSFVEMLPNAFELLENEYAKTGTWYSVLAFFVGIAISFTGPIGFIGLIIPHIVKLIYKKSATKLFLPTLFFGGAFLVICDLISRTLPTASALPIGVVTSFIGAPFFVYLLVRKKEVA